MLGEKYLRFSNREDVEESEEWYSLSKADPSTGAVTVVTYVFSATGKYTLEVPGNYKADRARFSLKATGGTPTGTASVIAN
jgi:hypothetical protein